MIYPVQHLLIHSKWPKVDLNPTLPKVLVNSLGPQVQIQREAFTIQIDSKEAWSDLGCKTTHRFSQDICHVSREKALEMIKQMAQTGDRLADIHEGIRIGPYTSEHAWTEPKEINVDSAPKNPPVITFQGGQQISWRLGEMDIQLQPGQINYGVELGQVIIDVYTYYRNLPMFDTQV